MFHAARARVHVFCLCTYLLSARGVPSPITHIKARIAPRKLYNVTTYSQELITFWEASKGCENQIHREMSMHAHGPSSNVHHILPQADLSFSEIETLCSAAVMIASCVSVVRKRNVCACVCVCVCVFTNVSV